MRDEDQRKILLVVTIIVFLAFAYGFVEGTAPESEGTIIP